MTTRLAVATSGDYPDLGGEGAVLLPALRRAGLDPEVIAWDGGHDPATYDAVLLRSTWDYHERCTEFLAWAHAQRRLINPAAMVAWNADKHYLSELAAHGVPTVPTLVVEPGEPGRSADGAAAQVADAWAGHDEIVVKPTISAAAADTGRFRRDDPAAGALLAEILASGRAALVQPYLADVDELGEASLVYFGGDFSHAARKAPILRKDRTAPPTDEELDDVRAVTPTAQEREVAGAALRRVTDRFGVPTYARIDLLPTPDGPVVLEVELVEPALWLDTDLHAPERFAAAVRAAIAG